MFKHITAITCVIKPLVDCFLNNPSPVIYFHAFINRSVVQELRQVAVCHVHGCQSSHPIFPSPVTSVVRKPEWITLSLLLTALMEVGLSKRPYIVFTSDGSAAINMA